MENEVTMLGVLLRSLLLYEVVLYAHANIYILQQPTTACLFFLALTVCKGTYAVV